MAGSAPSTACGAAESGTEATGAVVSGRALGATAAVAPFAAMVPFAAARRVGAVADRVTAVFPVPDVARVLIRLVGFAARRAGAGSAVSFDGTVPLRGVVVPFRAAAVPFREAGRARGAD